MIEAVILSLIGGIIGIACGIGGASILGSLLNSSMVVSPEVVIGSIAFTALVGIFFGFYPARKAANLNPIAALRFEQRRILCFSLWRGRLRYCFPLSTIDGRANLLYVFNL